MLNSPISPSTPSLGMLMEVRVSVSSLFLVSPFFPMMYLRHKSARESLIQCRWAPLHQVCPASRLTMLQMNLALSWLQATGFPNTRDLHAGGMNACSSMSRTRSRYRGCSQDAACDQPRTKGRCGAVAHN